MKKNTRNPSMFYALNVVVPVFVGALLYLLFRRDSFLSETVYTYISVPEISVSAMPPWVITFLRNFASDVLWAYALLFSVSAVLRYSRKRLLASILICICFAIIIEALQKVGVFSGTFDVLDIVFEILAIGFGAIIIFLYEEIKNEKEH